MPVYTASFDGTNNAISQGKSTKTYDDAQWFRWARTPACAPCTCGGLWIVKSTTAVCGVDLTGQTYCAIDVDSGSDDYGDMLATTGAQSCFVTYANVTDKPLAGAEEQYCHVRVWEPVQA